MKLEACHDGPGDDTEGIDAPPGSTGGGYDWSDAMRQGRGPSDERRTAIGECDNPVCRAIHTIRHDLGLTPGQWKQAFHGRRAGAA